MNKELKIFAWFAENLSQIDEPSLRLYVRAAELKLSGLEWRSLVPGTRPNMRKRLAAELISDSSLTTANDRVSEFVQRGGGCRATFYNYLRRLG